MSIRRNAIAAVAAVVALSGFVASTWTGASGESDAPIASADPNTGVGETLLLVVADVVDTADAAARLEALNQSFGELQGFYADTTSAYDVIGALLQTSADLLTEPCGRSAERVESLLGLDVIDAECPLGEIAKILQPITTTLVGVHGLTQVDTASLCARSGESCGLERVKRLLGQDLELDPGATLFATAFRTKRGAEEFLELARSAGIADLVTLQVKKLAGGDLGLGQEPAPDGSGPLTGPLAGQEQYQR